MFLLIIIESNAHENKIIMATYELPRITVGTYSSIVLLSKIYQIIKLLRRSNTNMHHGKQDTPSAP